MSYQQSTNILVISSQLYNIIKPGCVLGSRVVKDFTPNKQRFQKLDNCNYAIELGKQELNFKLVGIQGSNLLEGHRMFTLGKERESLVLFRIATLKVGVEKVGFQKLKYKSNKLHFT